MNEYPHSGPVDHSRRFQSKWFETFNWLGYLPTTDAAYCFPCFLFGKKPLGKSSSDTFTMQGFRNWKRVGGKDCVFVSHMGKDTNSAHAYSALCWENRKNPKGHVDTVIEKLAPKQIADNCLRLSVSITIVRWLTFQKCAFRGHDESATSLNQGNFLEMLKLIAYYNKDVQKVVLGNAPQNAQYIAPDIQKQILHIFAQKVQNEIRKEIERFLELVHVKDTTSKTLKEEITTVLSNHELSIQNLRGQGYDGASNMRGEWNGLQALFIEDCPYAYYVHCLAHQLQLALVAAAREVFEVHEFFKDLIFIVNVVNSSSKRHDELQDRQVTELEYLVEIEEVETGKGLNQIGTLKRPEDTRWSSHFKSIYSVVKMFNATRCVLETIATDRQATYAQRGDATYALKKLLPFDFLFILHVMQELMGYTDALYRVSDLHVPYSDFIRSRRNKDVISVEHHYRVDVFTATMDQQLQELNSRFSEQTTELLILSTTLNPIDGYKHFNVEKICRLAEKYYPEDFSNHENSKFHLKYQLDLFYCDAPKHPEMKNLCTIADLCRSLAETGKSDIYPLVDRLIRLILTLPVSTSTTERAFSAMKIVNTSLRNKMKDDFLSNYLVLYIEKEIAEKFTVESITSDFNSMKPRRVQFS
ncbi:uncharacterized protein [Spinacia oleracea]|uniref:TTF-type domain-containing protein n=1 Tax=Spinacia oleracea TaxID=3562 RepID=A0A9R0JDY1_SPIOL|nr:uncharacterized protein LOC110803483 [Spinacia oleracea]